MGRIILTTLLLLFATRAFPANHALIIGGGCEDPAIVDRTGGCPRGIYCDTAGPFRNHWNLFRPQFEIASQTLTRNGWSTRILYDGSEWQRPWRHSKPFTERSTLAYLRSSIRSFKRGDQFLLGIATHGSPHPHAICLGNGELMPISRLIPFLQELVDKGVKVAVIDSSCYSGSTVNELQLRNHGICAVSGTNPNTTSSGDSIWPYIFGLGLAPQHRVPSYYLQRIPSTTVDLDSNGRVSAAEAFSFARLHLRTNAIPRSSDCPMTGTSLSSVWSLVAPWMNINELNQIRRVSREEVCSLGGIPDFFESLSQKFPPVQNLLLNAELSMLGLQDNPPLPTRLTRLRQATTALISSFHSLRTHQDRVDQIMAQGQPVPADIRSQLEAAQNLGQSLKSAFFKELRPLLHLACIHEGTRRPSEQRPCENFDLFPAN